ncbi:MAG: hypothetical protein ACKPA9_34530 [Microcystis sp.]
MKGNAEKQISHATSISQKKIDPPRGGKKRKIEKRVKRVKRK